jgi:hypothetical protein
LSHDLVWTWDAYSHDAMGLPLYRDSPNGTEVELWIRLTIAGVTRVGVGIVGKEEMDLGKKLVSDALKNAANKFGIALDLWSKDELESLIGNQAIANRKRKAPKSSTSTDGGERKGKAKAPASDRMTAPDRNKLMVGLRRLPQPVIGDEAVLAFVQHVLALSEPVKALSELSAEQGQRLLEGLSEGTPPAAPPEQSTGNATANEDAGRPFDDA